MKIEIKVYPKSSREDIVKKGGAIKVYVQAPPDKGKANGAAIALIAREYGVKKSQVVIVKGATSRNKIMEIRL